MVQKSWFSNVQTCIFRWYKSCKFRCTKYIQPNVQNVRGVYLIVRQPQFPNVIQHFMCKTFFKGFKFVTRCSIFFWPKGDHRCRPAELPIFMKSWKTLEFCWIWFGAALVGRMALFVCFSLCFHIDLMQGCVLGPNSSAPERFYMLFNDVMTCASLMMYNNI